VRLLALLVWAALLGPGCGVFNPVEPAIVIRGPCEGPMTLILADGFEFRGLAPNDCLILGSTEEGEGARVRCESNGLVSEPSRYPEAGENVGCWKLVR